MTIVAELAKQGISADDLREISMVDLAYDVLKEQGEAMLFRDLLQQIVKLKGFTEEETNHYIAQLYTEINIDGRFVCVGKGLWGLKQWYPIEQATDSAVAANVKDDLEEELEEEVLMDEEGLEIDEEIVDDPDYDGLYDDEIDATDDTEIDELEEDEL